MGIRYTFTHRAEPHTVYTKDAFDKNIGKQIEVEFGPIKQPARICSIKVSDDGRSAEITVEFLSD